MSGWVRYVSLSAGASSPGQSELIANGYFYGPIDILLADDGQPRILYHDHDREDQVLAVRSGSRFTLQPMANVGHDGWYNTGVIRSEIGRFPDMEVDPDGSTLHLVYLALDASGGGVIRYAKGTVGAFEFQDLMSVTDFTIGFGGARDIATLDLTESGEPIVAIQTRSEMTVLRVGTQEVETLAQFQAQSGIQFMQQTEVVTDGSGMVHVIWWQSGEVPGTVCHGQLSLG